MSDEPIDYSQIYDFLYRIDRRINSLEKDSGFIEDNISSLELKKSREFEELKDSINSVKSQLSELKSLLNKCVGEMVWLGKELRETVKDEEMAEAKSRVNEIKFHEYVSRKALKKTV